VLQPPFVFDVAAVYAELNDLLVRDLQARQIPMDDLYEAIASHLVMSGYTRTYMALAAELSMDTPERRLRDLELLLSFRRLLLDVCSRQFFFPSN